MNEYGHLTLKDIYDYKYKRLAKDSPELDAIYKHIFVCKDCLKAIPPPTVEEFWKAMLDESNEEEDDLSAVLKRKFTLIRNFFSRLF